MKHLRTIVLAFIMAGAFIITACSNEPTVSKNGHSFGAGSGGSGGGGSITRTPVDGKFGIYESPYEVGDIVFNDGSATPYTAQLTLSNEQKAAAIAIIFYKGTGLNNGGDTTTSRTLGVGLKHDKTGREWCLNSANAYSKDITTIQDDDKNGSDNLSQIATFLSASGSGTTDDTGTTSNYPAFDFAITYSSTATNLGTTYANGWYLPSIAELYEIYNCRANNVNIDDASSLCEGDTFSTSYYYYWSSSQYASIDNYAYGLDFDDGGWVGSTKDFDEYRCVCAIRAFNQRNAVFPSFPCLTRESRIKSSLSNRLLFLCSGKIWNVWYNNSMEDVMPKALLDFMGFKFFIARWVQYFGM